MRTPTRRPLPAGHAFLVLAGALVLAAFLNARGMHKTAAEQPAGAPRDIALTLTAGLAGVSGFVGLDEPRRALKSALGRAGDDTISSRVSFARARRRPPDTASAVARPAFSPAHPLRLYLTGDSLLYDPEKEILERVQGVGAIEAVGPGVDTHAATGLAQPLVFNWFEYLPKQAASLRPNLVVLGFGGNDGQPLFGDGGGQPFGTPEWIAEYARRVGGVMDDFAAAGAKVMWVGLPIVRDPELSARFALMNRIYAAQAARRPGQVYFLDVYARFADARGRYADYLKDSSGQLALMRKPDGIHYELAGAKVVTDEVIAHLGRLVSLRAG